MKSKRDKKNGFRVTNVEVIIKTYKDSDVFVIPSKGELYDSKFMLINQKAEEFTNQCDRITENHTGFIYIFETDPFLTNDFRQFLIKHKEFIIKYILLRGDFTGTHLYQLYLQYVPYILSDAEKSLFLDAYINMLTNKHGTPISMEKRQTLEKLLGINQGD